MGGLSFNEEAKKQEVKITDIDFKAKIQTGTLADLDKAYGKITSVLTMNNFTVEEEKKEGHKDKFSEMLKKINPDVEELKPVEEDSKSKFSEMLRKISP